MPTRSRFKRSQAARQTPAERVGTEVSTTTALI